ncbi:MAG: type I restriction enzyme endonuclease domain-containing protein [Methylococcales bacterium]
MNRVGDVSEGVEDLFELLGLDKPDIGILSDEFLERRIKSDY